MPRFLIVPSCLVSLFLGLLSSACECAELRGRIVDADSGETISARLYISSSDGEWYWAKSASDSGSAVEYRKQRTPESFELHTTLSAHDFVANLPPGDYTITAERGKEYLPTTKEVRVGDDPVTVEIPLRRWIDLAERGWYSGDTHVHRTLEDLPNIIMAEDLNVALPLTNWVTTAYTPPGRGNKNTGGDIKPELISIDDTHVIYPVNTEYEIFTVDGNRHTLGAVFLLNHQSPVTIGAPPVGPIASAARQQGALLDLDKHSWPWSMMLVPIMNVDLFELSNNHIWRTEFAFYDWTIHTKPDFVEIETTEKGFTEKGWMDFGFATYYALLNCGFRMRPTAGTASGVHPVPLGFGRVYVDLPEGFSYEGWIDGLDAGRSFVTTGPMLFVEYNGQPPGHIFENATASTGCHITGSAESAVPLDRIEVIVNGDVIETIPPLNESTETGGFRSPLDTTVDIDGTSWVVVRCFEKHAGDRLRFAHGSPVHFEVAGKPLRPRRAAVEYMIRRMEEELARHQGVLKDDALAEYRAALDIYRKIAEKAR